MQVLTLHFEEVLTMKKLLAILISLCMVSAFAVPVFADANSDYIAAVKAYQAQIAAKEAAYTAAVDAYSCLLYTSDAADE